MDKATLQELFKKYLAKKASPEEVKQLLQHFQVRHEKDLLLDLIRSEMETPLEEPGLANIAEGAVYRRVQHALHARMDEDEERHKSAFYSNILRVAASMAAILLLAAGVFLWKNAERSYSATTYASYGNQAEVNLSDHSIVWLNSGATLSYPKHFEGSERDVTLKNGEAYFQVVHQTKKPFIVDAGLARITVLGTSFEVSNLENGKEITVSVNSGKVGVQPRIGHHAVTFLVAGQRAVIDKSSGNMEVRSIATADVAAWRQERLIFADQPLADVMQRLERKYNVQIKIENADLLSERVTMRLGNQPLPDVLTAISFANHFNYKIIHEKLIVIR